MQFPTKPELVQIIRTGEVLKRPDGIKSHVIRAREAPDGFRKIAEYVRQQGQGDLAEGYLDLATTIEAVLDSREVEVVGIPSEDWIKRLVGALPDAGTPVANEAQRIYVDAVADLRYGIYQ